MMICHFYSVSTIIYNDFAIPPNSFRPENVSRFAENSTKIVTYHPPRRRMLSLFILLRGAAAGAARAIPDEFDSDFRVRSALLYYYRSVADGQLSLTPPGEDGARSSAYFFCLLCFSYSLLTCTTRRSESPRAPERN